MRRRRVHYARAGMYETDHPIPQLDGNPKKHMAAVAGLGCVVCRNLEHEAAPAEYTGIHHIREGQGSSQRASDYETLPLCAAHHQTGGEGVAIHAGQKQWETKYGTELQLLMQVYLELEYLGRNAVHFPLCDCRFCKGAWPELVGMDIAEVVKMKEGIE